LPDNNPTISVWKQYIEENRPSFEKLFAQNVWKKAFLPWLKATREIKIRTILTSKDHVEIDMARGFALAIEQIMNLPQGIAATKQAEKQDTPEQTDTTDYMDGLAFDDE
jgi:hypothetical protein